MGAGNPPGCDTSGINIDMNQYTCQIKYSLKQKSDNCMLKKSKQNFFKPMTLTILLISPRQGVTLLTKVSIS